MTAARPLTVTFVQATRAWYFFASAAMYRERSIVEEISVSVLVDGQFSYEFIIEWVALRGGTVGTARVCVFDESFRAFTDLRPLFDALAGGNSLTVEECRDLLADVLDAEDATAEVNPKAATEPQDWQIIADQHVIASGSEEQMRSAFDAAENGRSHPDLSTVAPGVTLRLVHVESLRPARE